MRRSKPIIGLAGGVGSGKSEAAAAMARRGALVIESDRLNREVLAQPEVCEQLRRWWGPEVIGPDGRPDRRRIAEIVFRDAGERRRLESLVHPLIAARREDMISRGLADDAVRAIILDSPLLFESRLDRICDFIVFVESGESQRLERVRRTRGWDAEEWARRERPQWPLERKRRLASHVLSNDTTLEEFREAAGRLLERILERFAAQQET